MPRIILSVSLIALISGALIFGGTSAFFSDTETSTANVFTSGALDLKIDNASYYNGAFNEGTSWSLKDLAENDTFFFNFSDVKPDDYGENTTSIHIDTNDAYLCADVTLVANDDNDVTEPEALVDLNGDLTGELAGLVQFMWWADDGDNVLEDDEEVISGPGAIGTLPVGEKYPLALADSVNNIWTNAPGPIPGEETRFLGHAWCFGALASSSLPQDGENNVMAPDFDNNGDTVEGTPEDGGYTCDGTLLGNESQTDSLTLDISFEAVQARHNERFVCEGPTGASLATLTLIKNVINDDIGTAPASAWTLMADGPSDVSGVTGGSSVTLASVLPGEYALSETGPIGYVASPYSCVKNGGAPVLGNTITLEAEDVVVCTVTNDDADVLACTPQVRYADVVVNANQGVRKDGSLIALDRRNPAFALGAPQTTGTATDTPVPSSFFALGFNVGTTTTRSLTLAFTNNIILNGVGNDVRVYEVTGGVYPDEHVKVEASQDGVLWTVIANDAVRDANVDLGPLPWAKYIRVTDINSLAGFPNDADGYDVDAVEALNCGVIAQNN